MSPTRRIILACYGLAMAFAATWVPWRGGLAVRGGNRDALGYGLIWSPPKPSVASVEYEAARDAYLSSLSVASPGYTIVPPSNSLGFIPNEPKMPKDYISSFVYKSATVDYGRVGLEFAALSGLLLVAWMANALGHRDSTSAL